VGGVNGLQDASGNVVGRDFVNYWSGARLAMEGGIATVFDTEAFHGAQERLLGFEFAPHYWSYPPHLLLLLRPLATLDYLPALALWVGGTLGAFLWAARVTARHFGTHFDSASLLGLLVAPATMVGAWSGQNGFLTSALILGGIANLERRPTLAGFCFGLLTVKPHLGLLIPLLLLSQRAWRATVAAVGTTIALVVVSVLIDGPDPWRSLFVEITPNQRRVIEGFDGFFRTLMPSVFMAARQLNVPTTGAWIAQLLVSALAFAAVARGVFRSASNLDRAMLVVVGTYVVSPYTFVYDMPVLVAMSVIYVTSNRDYEMEPVERWIWFAVWISSAATIVGGALAVPLGPVILIAALVAVLRRVEASQPTAAPRVSRGGDFALPVFP
jgi:hypothetical protein